MRALITGVAGQDGTLLSSLLIGRQWEVSGSRLPNETLSHHHPLSSKQVVDLDVRNSDAVSEVISMLRPDVIFHLGFQFRTQN